MSFRFTTTDRLASKNDSPFSIQLKSCRVIADWTESFISLVEPSVLMAEQKILLFDWTNSWKLHKGKASRNKKIQKLSADNSFVSVSENFIHFSLELPWAVNFVQIRTLIATVLWQPREINMKVVFKEILKKSSSNVKIQTKIYFKETELFRFDIKKSGGNLCLFISNFFPFPSCSFPFLGDSVDIYDYSKDFHLSLKSLFLLFVQTPSLLLLRLDFKCDKIPMLRVRKSLQRSLTRIVDVSANLLFHETTEL